jgi:hypothetical protein
MTGFVGKCAKQSFSVTVFAHSPFKHGLCAHLPEANGGIVNVDINLLRLKPTQNKREIVSMISLTSEQRLRNAVVRENTKQRSASVKLHWCYATVGSSPCRNEDQIAIWFS